MKIAVVWNASPMKGEINIINGKRFCLSMLPAGAKYGFVFNHVCRMHYFPDWTGIIAA